MNNLIAAAAPDKWRIFQVLYEFAVDQDVDQINHLLLFGSEVGDDLIFHLAGKRLAGIESPGAFVITADTLVHAARNEQRTAGAGAINHIDWVVLMVIYSKCPPSYW